MKKTQLESSDTFMRFVLPLIFFVCLLSGCSLDEDVISECERAHPNSLQGQLVCQVRVTKRKETEEKELAAKKCLDGDEARIRNLVASIRDEVKSYAGMNLVDVNKRLEQKFPSQSFAYQSQQKDVKHNVIVMHVKTKCDSSYGVLVNIVSNDDSNKLTNFRAWENSPPGDVTGFNRYLPEFAWQGN